MLSRVAEQVGEGVAVFDNDARVLYANPAFATMHRTTTERMLTASFKGSLFYAPEEWNGRIQALMREALEQGVGRAEVVRRRLDGSTFEAHVTLSLLRDDAGDLVGRVLCVQDITERRRAEEELRRNERRLADAQAIARLGSWEWDLVTNVVSCSKQLHRIFELPLGSPISFADALARIHPDDRAEVERVLASSTESGLAFEIDHRIVRAEDGERIIHSRGAVVTDAGGRSVAMRGTSQDVTERWSAEKALREANGRLEALATTDVLTGLPNRALFADRLDHALAVARRERSGVSLLFIDLDRFKNVNDSLGHHRGDDVLVEVATRLRGVLRAGDTVARLGGDEFALLLSGATSPEDAATAAGRVLTTLRPCIAVGGMEFFLSASIGVALWPEDCSNKAELLQHADVAMYRAKAAGGDRFEMFQPAMTVAARERLRVEADLRRAIDNDEFFLRYQPQVDLRTGEVVGMEALVRWHHPHRGEVMPGEFIALAEETALIVPIGTWVLREACRQAQRWRTELPDRPPLRIAVNVAPRQLAQPEFVRLVEEALAATGTAPSELELEITENTLITDTGPAVAALTALRGLGTKIAIDDFGTGYSSLTYLRNFPVDRLKLDMSLTAEIGQMHDPGTQDHGALVAAAIDLAHALRLEAVAEGVEHENQRLALAAFGCENGQGYLWSRPMQAHEVVPWLSTFAEVPPPGHRP
ncbi:MAG: EAL domain-containing protein [Acidimicrobiales bacterium]